LAGCDAQELAYRPDAGELDVFAMNVLPLLSGHRERQHGVGAITAQLFNSALFGVGQ
jgi:hypothetical protein